MDKNRQRYIVSYQQSNIPVQLSITYCLSLKYLIIVFSQTADSAQLFYTLDLVRGNFIPRLAGRILPSWARFLLTVVRLLRCRRHTIHWDTSGMCTRKHLAHWKSKTKISHTQCRALFWQKELHGISWGSTLTNLQLYTNRLWRLHPVQPGLEILVSHSIPHSLNFLIKDSLLSVSLLLDYEPNLSYFVKDTYCSCFCHTVSRLQHFVTDSLSGG